jgi:hypothetical protein
LKTTIPVCPLFREEFELPLAQNRMKQIIQLRKEVRKLIEDFELQ